MIATSMATVLAGRRRSRPSFEARAISAFADAALLWVVVTMLGEYTLAHTAAGERFVFAPRGWGILADALVHVGLFTVFFLLYTLPAQSVRPWLGWCLRALMFGLFVVFVMFLQLTKVIGVVMPPAGGVILYRTLPVSTRVFTNVPNARLRATGMVKTLSFLDGSAEGLPTYPTYEWDEQGGKELARLATRVNIVQEP